MTRGDRFIYAIGSIVVLTALVTLLWAVYVVSAEPPLDTTAKAALAATAEPTQSPNPTAIPSPLKATPTPKPTRATPTTVPPTHTSQPTAVRPTQTPSPQRPSYRVVEALAGDTIIVSRAGKTYAICYAGIDAPDPGTVIGSMATQANRRFVKAKTVYLEKDTSETDQSDCLVRHVFLEDGTFVSAKLVYFGYATVRADYPNTRYRDALLKMQRWAKEAKFGLWNSGSGPGSIPVPTRIPLPPPTATPLPPTPTPVTATPTPTITPTPTKESVSGVTIAAIRYETNDDEYIEIKNQGTAPQDMTGWEIQSYKYNPGGCEPYEEQVYSFPSGHMLEAGVSVRIHSGEEPFANPPSDLLWDRRKIWHDNGDKAILYNAVDEVVDTYCYEECCP